MLKTICVLCLSTQIFASDCCVASKLGLRKLKEAKDVEAFFPLTKEDIENRKQAMVEGFDLTIDKLINSKIGFDTSAKYYDLAFGGLGYGAEMFEMVGMVHTDPEMRKLASDTGSELRKMTQQTLLKHPEIYVALESVERDGLTEEQNYFIDESLKELRAQGLSLKEGYRGVVRMLQSDLIDLSDKFLRNIREDKRTVVVSRDELRGMTDSFIDALQKNDEGDYILGMDYPTYFPILSQCQVSKTREKLLKAFYNRGHSANEAILKQISCKRHGLSHVLGHKNFASLQLQQEMVGSPERAKDFLDQMAQKLSTKQKAEVELLKKDLPEGVSLDADGNFYPWDLAYCLKEYRKKHFDLDEEKLKAYFPLEKTLRGLMDVYEKFMSIRLEEVDVNLWHEDVRLVKVSDPANGKLHGFIGLDLHPRAGKYNHACDVPVHPALACGRCDTAALSVLICNFPKGDPSLMRLGDVKTFFHEFGHALHDMLGRTEFVSTCGTNTKTDFVELPSQILEEWLGDKEVLQMCSSHYQTGEVLPDEIIEKLKSSKNAFRGLELMRQIMLSNFSLRLHTAPCQDLNKLYLELKTTYQPHLATFDEDHYHLSFGHLSHYAARYYGYLWSKVFALDVFAQIAKEGLLNSETGKRYIDHIIGRGGSKDPNELLENFLDRKPSQDAFFTHIGLHGN